MASAKSVKSGKKQHRSIGKALTPYAYLAPTILLFVVLMVIPICIVVNYSFQNEVIMVKTSKFVGLKNYAKILGDKVFREAVWNTVRFVFWSVILHMFIALSFALLLNTKLIRPGVRSVFRVIYIMPWVFTSAIVAILWRLMLNPAGVINYILQSSGIIAQPIEWMSERKLALYAIAFVNIWAGYPFFMVSLLAGLQGISDDLYEAATVDGANGFEKFLYVTVPQLKPIIISMMMLDCIWTTQQFALVWMTTGGGPVHATELLGTYTYRLAFGKYKFALASTSAVIIFIITLLLALIYVNNQKARD